MFPVYGGNCLSRQEFQNSVEKLSQGRSKVADDARQVRKCLRQQSKDSITISSPSYVQTLVSSTGSHLKFLNF
jgi:hypothetical protein